MSEDLKFQQMWEFRRRDSDVDSSSDKSKLSSSGEPVLKRHKLVSSLISPENDETSGTPRPQPEDKSDRSSGDQFKIWESKQNADWIDQKETLIGSQLWWHWEGIDLNFGIGAHGGWKQ